MLVEKVERIAELPRDMSGDMAVSRAGGGVDGRATRFTREVRMAEELLARELGPDWRSKINELGREERLQLAKKLHAMGISNAPAITRALRLSGRELRALKPANSSTGQRGVKEDNIKTLDAQQPKPIMDKDSTWPHNLHHDQHVYHELLELHKKIDAFAEELDEVKTRLAKIEEEKDRLIKMLVEIAEIVGKLIKLIDKSQESRASGTSSQLNVTKEGVQRLIEDERRKALEELNPEELKAILEGYGYKVLEPPSLGRRLRSSSRRLEGRAMRWPRMIRR